MSGPKMTYELVVTRDEAQELMPVYTAFIYRMVEAGVCGPFTNEETFVGMGEVIAWTESLGYKVEGWPEISHNTATYRLLSVA